MARRRFAEYPPWFKIGLWLGVIVLSAGFVQLGAWLIGIDFGILRDGLGRTILISVALASLLAIMMADRRPLAEYGLQVGENWTRQAWLGFAVGFVFYAGYCIVSLATGGQVLNTGSVTTDRVLTATFAALTAIPVAATQQIIFSGYLLTMLRGAVGRMGAVLTSAALFAALACLGRSSDTLWTTETAGLVIGLFLIATVLGLLRLQQGNIVLAASLLAGCIAVRRLVRKTHLLALADSSEWTPWLAPGNDPRKGPLMWVVILIAIVATWWLLRRRGEPAVATDQPVLSASFKRVFPFSNIFSLAPLDLWLSALVEARFRVGWEYLARLGWILLVSSVNTVLSLPERLLVPLFVRHRVPDPVFIVGVHRSGTTHLHNLLALDSRFCVPRNLHVMNPFGVLFSGWLITPLLGIFMNMRRPMDAVRVNLLTPQEDEFAVACMTRMSPYWAFTFPRSVGRYDRYIFPGDFTASELATWKQCLMQFLRRLTFWTRKSPLLKSPYHTGRVHVLREMFPRAKFIHLVRNPYDVYRSNMHLVREGMVIWQLQDPDVNDSYSTRFLENYLGLEEAFYRDASALPGEDVAELKFEDLERDAIGQIERVYSELGLEITSKFRQRLEDYLEDVSDYKKNRHRELPDGERSQIDAVMGSLTRRWGYDTASRTEAA